MSFPSARAVGEVILPGFNRGNVDWFRILRPQAKNSLWRYLEEVWAANGDPGKVRYSCDLSRETPRKFSQAVRERSLGAIIPNKWQMGSKAGEEQPFTSGSAPRPDERKTGAGDEAELDTGETDLEPIRCRGSFR
jgi:hypothetical protein